MLSLAHSLSVLLLNQQPAWALNILTGGLLYLGPNTVLPIATTIATVLGFILIFWRLILKGLLKPFRFVYSRVTGKPMVEPGKDALPVENQDNKPDL